MHLHITSMLFFLAPTLISSTMGASPPGIFSKGIMELITTYINEAIQELHQVRWPTRQQAVRLSIIVIGFTAACSVSFGAIDFLLNRGVLFLLNLL